MLYVLMLYGVLCLTSSWGDTTTDTPQEPVGLTESFTLSTYLMILQRIPVSQRCCGELWRLVGCLLPPAGVLRHAAWLVGDMEYVV